jgi:hypothetical protein
VTLALHLGVDRFGVLVWDLRPVHFVVEGAPGVPNPLHSQVDRFGVLA